jgi:hypothetical protein
MGTISTEPLRFGRFRPKPCERGLQSALLIVVLARMGWKPTWGSGFLKAIRQRLEQSPGLRQLEQHFRRRIVDVMVRLGDVEREERASVPTPLKILTRILPAGRCRNDPSSMRRSIMSRC